MRSHAPRRLEVIPNLTPLVNVALLVMVIFLALAPLFGRQMPVMLTPVELKVAEVLPPDQVVIRVSPTGVAVNGQPVLEEQLRDALKPLIAQNLEGLVLIDADLELPYERVVNLLDIVREAGGRSVGLTPDLSTFVSPVTPGDPAATSGNLPVTTTEIAP